MKILEDLKWRYATKEFDTTKKLSKNQFNTIIESINLTATSFGLQPFKVIVVENEETRNKLKLASFNQSQITESSHVIVFAAYTNTDTSTVEQFLNRIVKTRGISRSNLQEYETMMNNFVGKPKEELFQWASNQCYIALGNLLSVSAQLKIDTCPMEGFDHNEFDDILNLKKDNLSAIVMATLGFRSEDDKYQHFPKVRKQLDELVITK